MLRLLSLCGLRRRFILAALATVFLVSGGTLVNATPALAAQAPFNFCNETGGKIACFSADIAFTSSTSFVLSNIKLSDTLADNRGVYAGVWGPVGSWFVAEKNGEPYFYANNNGANTTKTFPTHTFTQPSGKISYVYISLFGGNNVGGNSTIVYSNKRDNPFA
jgi:hypothetical protein